MLTSHTIQAVLRQPWWSVVKNEVARVIAIRAKATDDRLKPHGSVLGQMFIEMMNDQPDLREYVHYLTSRGWIELVSDIEPDLSPEMSQALRHEEGGLWFREFQQFLNTAWKSSVPSQATGEVFTVTRNIYVAVRDELALHLERKASPALMANAMLELMRDESDPSTRRASILSFTFLSVRSWPEILKALSRKFSEDLGKWDTPEAAAYFEKFKAMIVAQVDAFWEGTNSRTPGQEVE